MSGQSDVLGPADAARALFDDPRATVDFQAQDEAEARVAVVEFARLFATLPGVARQALDGARAGAETLSGDRLQGLSEIIQNADDAGATKVWFRVADQSLLATHNGRDVTLSDVLALATPWLSNKTEQATSTGRFGIGLMTLRALSDVLDVQSGHYRLRLGDPTISALSAADFPADLGGVGRTVLRLPVQRGALTSEDVASWLGRWDDSALLFLRNVRMVSVFEGTQEPLHSLRLDWRVDDSRRCVVGERELAVSRRHASAPDGRGWLVHSVEAQTPPGVTRRRKATGDTIPLGIALALQPGELGMICAGLPIVGTRAPLRVNAQFDPVTSRTGLADTPWNAALLPLLADLWLEVAKDLFAEHPNLAWDAMPLPAEIGSLATESLVAKLEELLLARARSELALHVELLANGQSLTLGKLAVEDADLEGVITPTEIARLAHLPAALPDSARDAAGRWRAVLDDWCDAGAPLPEPVQVEQAVALLQEPERGTWSAIALSAVAIRRDLGDLLRRLPCVTTSEGDRVVPPGPNSPEVLTSHGSQLADLLGMAKQLAPEHLAQEDDAELVLNWLGRIGAFIDSADPPDVIRRLAAAGRAGNVLAGPLTVDQLRGLRDAFESLPVPERSEFGRDVGRAITIEAFRYGPKGQLEHLPSRPVDVYLSRAIDREHDSFAAAAGKTPGLLWTHGRYSDQLRSSLGRSGGLGAQKFFGLLGAERAPRLVPHEGLSNRYADRPRGLPAGAAGSPTQRARALEALNATYTLEDIDCPDLRAVVLDIGRQRGARKRRERADALLGALARAWDRLSESAEVTAANDNYGWQSRGPVRAFWAWSIGSIAWLDDTSGTARAPLDLRLRTTGTLAVHGPDATGYLRPEFDLPNRRELLAVIGVSGEPSTSELVLRLRELRGKATESTTVTDAAILYQALASRLGDRLTIPGDLSLRDLRSAFNEGPGLVLTKMGWRRPPDVLSGSAIFRSYHPFVPQVPGADRLWSSLGVRSPSIQDGLRVLGVMSRSRKSPAGEDEAVLLETLRFLNLELARGSDPGPSTRRRLGSLPLFTTQGWTAKRPIYGVDEPALVQGLGRQLPVWRPGGDVRQFEALMPLLRVRQLTRESTHVATPERSLWDPDATELFTEAVSLLREDLVRNDPEQLEALSVSWDELGSLDVRVDPDLRVHVSGIAERKYLAVDVPAKIDLQHGAIFVRRVELLRAVNAAGYAVAALFQDVDQRHIAQAWLAACVATEDGRAATPLSLATQDAAEERERIEQDMEERLDAFRRGTAERHRQLDKALKEAPRSEKAARSASPAPRPDRPGRTAPPRRLVDVSKLVVIDPQGTKGSPAASGRRPATKARGPLPQAIPGGAPPHSVTPAASFTMLDKETVGLELLRLVLARDDQDILDIRAQRGVGADALDQLDERYFELKVHLGEEPDEIRLEESGVRRAMSTPDFFLVIVSNVEGVNARPRVRIIIDPLTQLSLTQSSAVTFSGVRSAPHSLIYQLGPTDGLGTDRSGTSPVESGGASG